MEHFKIKLEENTIKSKKSTAIYIVVFIELGDIPPLPEAGVVRWNNGGAVVTVWSHTYV